MNYPCAHSGMFFTTGDLKGALITNTGFIKNTIIFIFYILLFYSYFKDNHLNFNFKHILCI